MPLHIFSSGKWDGAGAETVDRIRPGSTHYPRDGATATAEERRQPVEDRLRVALLGSFPPQAQGIQDYCGELAQALSARCEVTALGFRRMYPALLFPGVKKTFDPGKAAPAGPGLRVYHRLAWYNPFGWLRAALFTPCDVFHAQWWSLPLLPVFLVFTAIMKMRGKPVVLTVHNVLPHEKSRLFVLAEKMLCAMADAVIVHSRLNREQLIDLCGLPPGRVCRIPMSAHRNPPPPISRNEARQALGLPEKVPVLLSFGVIRPYKGIDVLLHAFARIHAKHPEARLVIAGKPWMPWAPLQAVIDENGLAGRVDLFLDYIPAERSPLFFTAADLILLPYTHFDAQSAVGAQVLPYKRPVIASEAGGLPEWVDHEADWIAPPGNAEALAEKIDAFLEDIPGRTAAFEEIAEKVLRNSSAENVACLHHALYLNVVQGSELPESG
jgi:glycosyltransferase involved in cell wall biosynthesis